MSLNGALQVGQSAILASQAAISVAGNNMANAATPGYHRQRIGIIPGRPEAIGRGQFVGTGVQIGSITRQIDVALQARMRTAICSSVACCGTLWWTSSLWWGRRTSQSGSQRKASG